jgi:hypothetical protein
MTTPGGSSAGGSRGIRIDLRLVWLLVPLAAVAELVAHSVILARVPAADDFDGAAEAVRAGYREGDLVVVAPGWLAEARRALGPEVMPLRDQARPDEARYQRLWEVSIRGASAVEAAGLEPELERRFGRVTLRRYPMRPRARTLWDFVDRLGDARVLEIDGVRRRPCAKQGNRWRCVPHSRDIWVGTETISDLDHRPRRCIWAHPLPRGKALRIELSDVPRGSALEGHTATDYVVGRHCGPAPVDLAIEVDGQILSRIEHHDCDGWSPFAVDIPPGSGPVDVAFIVTAPDPDRRHFCFQAEMRSLP